MIVSVSGYNWSGSSAVMDLLKEYEETIVITEPEWYLIDQPDGVRDLEFHTSGIGTYFNGDVAVKRFLEYVATREDYQKATKGAFRGLSEAYIHDLVQASWRGCSIYDCYRLSPFKKKCWHVKNIISVILRKATKKNISFVNRDMYLCVKPTDFIGRTQKYVKDVIYAAGGEEEKINVVKHLFPANNPESAFKYVDNPYVIVVDRDPRDIFVQCTKVGATCFPTKDVVQFVDYYKSWRGNKSNISSERILWVQFEDLVYKYEETVKKIEEFLHIKNHMSKQKYFEPCKSKKTTNLFKKFPEFSEQIKYIEQQLPEFLYEFE